MMKRTQIYLSNEQVKDLHKLAKRSGKSQSWLIREAVTEYVARSDNWGASSGLSQSFGLWKDRKDLPSFEEIRGSLDREFE